MKYAISNRNENSSVLCFVIISISVITMDRDLKKVPHWVYR